MRYFTFLSFLTALSFSALLQAKKSSWSWPPTEKPASVDLSKFSLDPDLEVTLWAKSPMLYNPTNMAIDPQGRIWIAEGVNYREKLGIRREAGDRIVVLIDSDGDGSADKSKVFWQDPYLESPLGIAVFDNQIVISQPPDIVVLTDVDRNLQFDPSVDKKEVLLTGFNGRQHDHSLHSVTSGPDGKWYFNSGNCGAIFTDNSGKTFRMNTNYRGGASEEYFYTPTNELKGAKSDDGYVWSSGFSVRMNPDGTDAEIIGHGYRNSYEQVVSSMGDLFQSDNDDYSSCRNSYVLEYGSAGYYSLDGQHKWQASKRSGQAIQRAHWRQDNPGTFDTGDVYGAGGPTGVAFYENGALGKKWEGTYLSCEATRNVVFGYHPKPVGATYSLDRFDFVSTAATASELNKESEEEAEKRIHFRPADLDIGPDGAIYIADWHDERSGGHSTQDESASGAIYRIAPRNFKPVIPSLDLKNVEGAIAALKSPNPAVRFLGFQALKKFGNAALPSVEKLIDHQNPYIAARAIWLLPHLGKDGKKKSIELLNSSDRNQRLVAYRSLRRIGENMVPHARKLASDADTGIRRDVALSLRSIPFEKSKDLFVELAKGYDGKDKNYLEAMGLGATGKENEVWKHLRTSLGFADSSKWTDAFSRITWRLWPSDAIADLVNRAQNSKLSTEQRKFAIESIAFIDHQSAPDALLELGKSIEDKELSEWIVEWTIRQSFTDWGKYNVKDKLKTAGIFDADAVALVPISTPEPIGKSNLKVADIAKLSGDPQKGKTTIMRCSMCHEVNGIGVNFGPRLEGWAAKQSKNAVIHAIVNPSQGIAHGFGGTEYVLKDGSLLHGITEAHGDPAIVLSQGGLSQLVPRSKVKASKPMKRSLMLSAEQLGMTAQDVADVVAFMKDYN
jgi:putative membrane-bound dehydrogenase-like protein